VPDAASNASPAHSYSTARRPFRPLVAKFFSSDTEFEDEDEVQCIYMKE